MSDLILIAFGGAFGGLIAILYQCQKHLERIEKKLVEISRQISNDKE